MRTVNPPASCVRRFESDPYHHSCSNDDHAVDRHVHFITSTWQVIKDPLKFDIKSGFGRIRIVEKAKKWILIVLGGILLYLYKTCTG